MVSPIIETWLEVELHELPLNTEYSLISMHQGWQSIGSQAVLKKMEYSEWLNSRLYPTSLTYKGSGDWSFTISSLPQITNCISTAPSLTSSVWASIYNVCLVGAEVEISRLVKETSSPFFKVIWEFDHKFALSSLL